MIVELIYRTTKIFYLNLKNVIMIRLLILGFSILISGCSRYSTYFRYGVIKKEYNAYYINDSLRFSYEFPSDYEQVVDKRQINSKLDSLELHNLQHYLLGYFKTKDAPMLEHFVFFIPKTKATLLNACSLKDTTVIDVNNFFIYKKSSIDFKGSILILAFSKQQYFENLKNEYIAQVFPSLNIGVNYKSNMKFKDPFSLARDLSLNSDSTVNYLLPLLKLENSIENYNSENMEYTYIQTLATFNSFISNLESKQYELNKQWQSKNYMSKRDYSKIKILFYDHEVISQIIEKCKNQSIVMINENHFSPNHRLLVNLLLDSLYANGFRYFGLEALWENTNDLHSRGYCITKSGFYTREPSMSNLINYAIKKGYKVFGYDDYSNQREANQAKNIYEATFKKDINAKVIILAGFGHISENQSNSKNMMASEFFKAYKINPLTIDQCEFDTKINKNYLAYIDTNSIKNEKKLKADIYISNNLDYNIFSLLMGYSKRKIQVNHELQDYPYIISFFNKSNYSDNKTTIPIYNYIIRNKNNQNKINLYLPNIELEWSIKNKNNKCFKNNFISIN